MLKWVSLLGISTAMCVFTCGCSTDAGGIAASYGTLGSGWFSKNTQKKVIELIESGEADRMVADGKTEKRTYEKGAGEGQVLVTEHLILGQVYRVEVRNHVNPAMDVLTTNVRQVTYGPADRELFTVNPFERADVLRAIQYYSYDGQGTVAYRAFIGSDGSFHPVRTQPGDIPDWSDRNAIDLVLRTDVWPAGVLHYRGVRPAGTSPNGRLLEPDGRWLVMSDVPGVSPVKWFVNKKLHCQLKAIGAGQCYDLNVLNTPPSAVGQ